MATLYPMTVGGASREALGMPAYSAGPRERRTRGLYEGLTALGAGLLAGGAPRVGAPAGASAFAPGLLAFQEALSRDRDRVLAAEQRAFDRDIAERTLGVAERKQAAEEAAVTRGLAATQSVYDQVTDPTQALTPAGPTVAAAAATPNFSPNQLARLNAARMTGDPEVLADTLKDIRDEDPEIAAAMAGATRAAQIEAQGGVPISGLGMYQPSTGLIDGVEQVTDATILRERGVTAARQGLAPGQRPLTEFEQARDREFGKNVLGPYLKGQGADINKQLEQLALAQQALSSGRDISGSIRSMAPDWLRARIDTEGLTTQRLVEEVVQRNLREVLGAQFTEKEGQQLTRRAYDPNLPEEVNRRNVARLFKSIRDAALIRQKNIQHAMRHGTVRGLPMNSLESIAAGAGLDPTGLREGTQSATVPDAGNAANPAPTITRRPDVPAVTYYREGAPITRSYIETLLSMRSDPEARKRFDADYGEGAADYILHLYGGAAGR